MSITKIEIDKKYFDIYEGNSNVFYSKPLDVFVSLCNKNVYGFQIQQHENYQFLESSTYYPTCLLESSVDIDEITEKNDKKTYVNRYCHSLFSNINQFFVSKNYVFLATDDFSIHQYILMRSESCRDDENEKDGKEGGEGEDQHNILFCDSSDDLKEGGKYSTNYNWIYMKKIRIWKSLKVVVSCFYYQPNNNKEEEEEDCLIVGYHDGSIQVFNLKTYKIKESYKIHNSKITCLKMYRNFIISTDVTKNIFIYDCKKRRKFITCEDHLAAISTLLFLEVETDAGEENEKVIGMVSIGEDKIMNIWNLNILNEKEANELETPEDVFTELGDQCNGKEEVEMESKEIKKERKKKRKKEKREQNNVNVTRMDPIKQIFLRNDLNSALIISANLVKKKSKEIVKNDNIKWLILTHDEKGSLYFYNPVTGEVIYKFKENGMVLNKSNISRFFLINNELYIFRSDCSLLIYNMNTFEIKRNYICKLEGIFELVLLRTNSNNSYNNDTNNKLENEKKEHEKEKEDQIKAIVLVGDPIIRILKFDDLISQELLIGHSDVVSCIKVDQTNMLLFSGSNDKEIWVWDLKTHDCLYKLKDHLHSINAIDVYVKKYPVITVVSVCDDNSLKMWKFSIQTSKKRKVDEQENGMKEEKNVIRSSLTIYPHNMLINDVAISSNGKMIATCSKDKKVKLFETKTLKLIHTLEGHKKFVQNVIFSPGQNILYSYSYDCLKIWELDKFECIKSIQSLDFNITKVLLYNDNYCVNGYSNGNINIINIKNCERGNFINYHADKIFCLKNFGESIISASINGEVLFFKNATERNIKENTIEKRKSLYYENCLEDLLKQGKINESLLICLKLDKKFKFKTIVEHYFNSCTFSILNILKKYEFEHEMKKIRYDTVDSSGGLIKNKEELNILEDKKEEKTEKDDEMDLSLSNHIEHSKFLEDYIYNELLKEAESHKDNSLSNDKKHFLKCISEDDDNFVLFLRKMKDQNEHSYYLYLNKLIEFITFFVMNHRYAYISNFLLNSLLTYIDYSDICKINNYQHFFEIYNSYVPRHKNRYLKSLQKSKFFELINLTYYKGDIKMMS